MGGVLPAGHRRTDDGHHEAALKRGAAAALLVVACWPAASGAQSGLDTSRFSQIPALVEDAIHDRKLTGAVVLIGRGDQVVYEKAIGNRGVEPAVEAMTADTIFDLASLTKVVATTTSVMKLLEDGKIRLSDRVSSFIPGL